MRHSDDVFIVAYEVLSNEEKRRIYDQEGEEGLNDDGRGGGGDPFDIFSSFFGGGGGRRGRGRSQKQQLAPLHIQLPVTLKDLYNGRTFRVRVSLRLRLRYLHQRRA